MTKLTAAAWNKVELDAPRGRRLIIQTHRNVKM